MKWVIGRAFMLVALAVTLAKFAGAQEIKEAKPPQMQTALNASSIRSGDVLILSTTITSPSDFEGSVRFDSRACSTFTQERRDLAAASAGRDGEVHSGREAGHYCDSGRRGIESG